MSRTTAVMLQDRLNDIERNICDGIDFRQELNEAYALADELETENEKLRERLKESDDGRMRQADNLIDKYHKIARLQTENDKLRKLAKQMHVCLTRPKVYDGKHPYLTATECPYFTEGDCDYSSCGFEQRMQALGIEVPE